MKTIDFSQSTFLVESSLSKFPSTRYQGSKAKIVDWITKTLSDIEFTSCLDAFGGTGAVSYKFKKQGKLVTYNDLLRFNYYFGLALIENKKTKLDLNEIEWILSKHTNIKYSNFIESTFHDIYFTDIENKWLDQTISNINQISQSI